MPQIAKEADLLQIYPHDVGSLRWYHQEDLPEAAALALLDSGDLYDKIVVMKHRI